VPFQPFGPRQSAGIVNTHQSIPHHNLDTTMLERH